MAVTLTLTGKTPSNNQFGLDTFAEHYKCDATADVVLTDAGVPQIGDAHPDYPFMFITGRPCSETGESASALDLIYTGCLTDDGDGNPVLPLAVQQYGSSIQTASNGITVTGVVGPAVSMEYYAQTSTTTFISYNAPGDVGTAPDPINDPIVRSVTVQDATYAPSSIGIDAFIAAFFVITETDIIQSQELVIGGKFWSNVELKTKFYGPPLFIV